MAVMASWNGKTWGVSSQRIAALNGVSHSVELDTENSDDKAGSPATKTKALKLQSMSFDFDLAAAVGCDVRSEYESWTALVGQYAPFYLAGRRFGPANLQLTGVSLSDTKLDNLGRILTGKITIKLTEYAEEASSKKASSGKSSSSGKSGSSSKSAAGIVIARQTDTAVMLVIGNRQTEPVEMDEEGRPRNGGYARAFLSLAPFMTRHQADSRYTCEEGWMIVNLRIPWKKGDAV